MRKSGKRLYRLITGFTLDLSKLTPEERSFIAHIHAIYGKSLDWTKFTSLWWREFDRRKLNPEGLANRICEDLEARLGIAQGEVAPPDYRDYLSDLIDDKFGSHYKFCKKTGVDPAHLSRVFAGRSDLSLEALAEVLPALGMAIVIQPIEQIKANTSPDAARRALAGVA